MELRKEVSRLKHLVMSLKEKIVASEDCNSSTSSDATADNSQDKKKRGLFGVRQMVGLRRSGSAKSDKAVHVEGGDKSSAEERSEETMREKDQRISELHSKLEVCGCLAALYFVYVYA
jgi:hypothetical protein